MPRAKTIPVTLDAVTPEFAPLVRRWLLKLLVPLGGYRQFVLSHGFQDDSIAGFLGLGKWIDTDEYDFESRRIISHLRRLYRAGNARSVGLPTTSVLSTRLVQLSQWLGLSELDCRLLEFAVIIHTERVLDDAADLLGSLTASKLIQVLAELVEHPQASVRMALSPQAPLARSGLLSIDHGGAGFLRSRLDLLSPQLAERLCHSSGEPLDLMCDILLPTPPAHLQRSDFQYLEADLQILDGYLRHALEQGRAGVNVLLHGAPGTGKTQLTRLLAGELRYPLYEVASADEDGDPMPGERRLRAFRAAQSMLARQRALVLFDEFEDIFIERFSLMGSHRALGARKAWMNRMLEENPIPAFWVSNSIEDLDPALVRRFDLVLELPVPPRQQRIRILEQHCSGLLPKAGIARIAESEALAPAIVSRSAAVIQAIHSGLGQENAAVAFEKLLNHTLTAQGKPAIARRARAEPDELYDPAFLETDADLAMVSAGLERTGEGRLCLHGPPGTGKTAWARWLAETLDRPLCVQRASDLLSKWLGESEQNLARVFRMAERDKAILLIDEVDSFLYGRHSGQQSWEVTLVNEMLTQMEVFAGIFIASTNRMDGLDEAALRRFDLKVGFDFLSPQRTRALAERYLEHLGMDAESTTDRPVWESLEQVTPGDFATVLRQHRFRPLTSARDLFQRLESECRLKHGSRRAIGFQP